MLALAEEVRVTAAAFYVVMAKMLMTMDCDFGSSLGDGDNVGKGNWNWD
jgi:hypothetical protein